MRNRTLLVVTIATVLAAATQSPSAAPMISKFAIGAATNATSAIERVGEYGGYGDYYPRHHYYHGDEDYYRPRRYGDDYYYPRQRYYRYDRSYQYWR